MADVMKIVYGATTINLSPLEGYIAPGRSKIIRRESLSGTLYTFKRGHKERYEIPVNNISKADADYINSWWENNYSVVFSPDIPNAPSYAVTVKIVNEDAPLSMMAPHWASKYQGTIILQEI